MGIDETVWNYLQDHLGYTDDQMTVFRADPKNEHIIAKGLEAMNKEVIFEVIESNGCNSGHKKGDRICFDAFGNLMTGRCPERVCVHAVEAGSHALFAAGELVYHGIDPDNMRFKRFGCMDVGVKCGGWGHVIMEIKVREASEPKQK